MNIEQFLKTSDDPKAVISYPVRQVYEGTNGEIVLGLNTISIAAKASEKKIISPVNIIRRPGLGDKLFSLAVTYQFIKENPDMDVTFSGLDSDNTGWLKKSIDWVKIGVNEECNSIVNLDNTPPNGGDRCQLMGKILGVDVEAMEFPIKVMKYKCPPSPYYVFSPFANRLGPRSFPLGVVNDICANSPIPIAFTDAIHYDIQMSKNCYNVSGIGMLELIALVKNSEGVIGVDTGVPWLAAALGKRSLIFFCHVPSKDRTMTTYNVVAVDSPAKCAPCGDHVGTMPECRFSQKVPICQSFYTSDFIRYKMVEFDRMV